MPNIDDNPREFCTPSDTEEKPHGPARAGYSNMTWPQTPWIECLCGWETSRGNKTWEEVGSEFDEHLNS